MFLLRVKRKATETPVEALEVTGGGSAKRRKTASAVFRLKSEDKTAPTRKRKNVVGPGGGDAGGKEERKRFKVVQADGDAKVGPQSMCFFSLNIGHSTAFLSEMRTFGQRGRQGPDSILRQNVCK